MAEPFGIQSGVLVMLEGNPTVGNLQGWVTDSEFSESDFSAMLEGCGIVRIWTQEQLAKILGEKPIKRMEELLKEGGLKSGDPLGFGERIPCLKSQTPGLNSFLGMCDGGEP